MLQASNVSQLGSQGAGLKVKIPPSSVEVAITPSNVEAIPGKATPQNLTIRRGESCPNTPITSDIPKQTVPIYAPIVDYETYESYKKMWEEKHVTYDELNRGLTENSDYFKALQAELQGSNGKDKEERRKLKDKIQSEIRVRKAQVEGMSTQYKILHLDLINIKKCVSDFVEGWDASKKKKKTKLESQV
jgi:hypothetical protein